MHHPPILPRPQPLAAAAMALLMAGWALPQARAAELTVTVEPITEAKGTLQVAVYASEPTYRKQAVRAVRLPATPGAMTVRLNDLPPGDYAVTVFHDRNGNDQLDTNFLGIPREPWGASTGGKPVAGAPTWADARFALPPAGAVVRIRLND